MAATGLLMLPAWNIVWAVTGVPRGPATPNPPRPLDGAVVDDRDADARHVVGDHAILKRLDKVRSRSYRRRASGDRHKPVRCDAGFRMRARSAPPPVAVRQVPPQQRPVQPTAMIAARSATISDSHEDDSHVGSRGRDERGPATLHDGCPLSTTFGLSSLVRMSTM